MPFNLVLIAAIIWIKDDPSNVLYVNFNLLCYNKLHKICATVYGIVYGHCSYFCNLLCKCTAWPTVSSGYVSLPIPLYICDICDTADPF